jgi:hypothetical protein
MGGLVLDVYVEYLVRVVIRFVRVLRGRAWRTEKAEVTSTGHRPAGLGCAIADLTYKYFVAGEPFTGTEAKPFIMTSSAEDYTSHYCTGSGIIVRVDPQKPESSFMQEGDQWSLPERRNS